MHVIDFISDPLIRAKNFVWKNNKLIERNSVSEFWKNVYNLLGKNSIQKDIEDEGE